MIKTTFSIDVTEYEIKGSLEGFEQNIKTIVLRAPLINDGPLCSKLQAMVKNSGTSYAARNQKVLSQADSEDGKAAADELRKELENDHEKALEQSAMLYRVVIQSDVENVVDILEIFKKLLPKLCYFKDDNGNRIEYKYDILKMQPTELLYKMISEYMANFLALG